MSGAQIDQMAPMLARGQERDQRDFGVGQDRHDAVALLHAHLPQMRRDAGDPRAQLGPGQSPTGRKSRTAR